MNYFVLNKVLLFIVIGVTTLMTPYAVSAPIEHLNVGQITVTDQSTFAQKRAGKKAFQQVIVKMSGDPNTLNNAQVKKSAASFEQFLIASSFSQDGEKLVYQAEFNQQKIVELLRSEGLNIWGARRPSALLWLVIEDDSTKIKNLITQQNNVNYSNIVQQAAYQRGIEIVMPIGDLTDSMNVAPMDVWGLFSSSIYNKSARYNTNYVIGAKIGVVFDNFTASEKLQLSYFVTNGQTIKTTDIVGNDVNTLLAEFVDQYSSYLAGVYAIDTSETTEFFEVKLSVSKIDTLMKYRKVLEILSSLTVTQNVEISSQTKDISTFQLRSNVSPARLKTILELEKSLRVPEYQSLAPSSPSGKVLIDYEWRGN